VDKASTGNADPVRNPSLRPGEQVLLEALLRSRQTARRLFDATPDHALLLDADGTILAANASVAAAMGGSPADVVGRGLHELLPWEQFEEILLAMDRVLCAGRQETCVCRRGGRVEEVLLSPAGDRGRLGEVACLSRDVTARLGREEELRRARDKAEQASRAKSEFLANMSHEIRTPLTGIIGMTALVLRDTLSERQREQLGKVLQLSDHLLRTIEDVLDFSRIESGKLCLEESDFDLGEVMESVLNTLRPEAEKKSLVLAAEAAPDLPSRLRGDPVRLRQVLLNLVGNAVKFTPAGSVRLAAGAEQLPDAQDQSPPDPSGPKAAGGPVARDSGAAQAGAQVPVTPNPAASSPGGRLCVRFQVEDTGIGVPEDKREAIFESFTQADGSYARRYGGSGLGLAISRKLVALMGGDISLASSQGRGSTFTFTARFHQGGCPEPSRAAPADGPARKPLRILLAEEIGRAHV